MSSMAAVLKALRLQDNSHILCLGPGPPLRLDLRLVMEFTFYFLLEDHLAADHLWSADYKLRIAAL